LLKGQRGAGRRDDVQTHPLAEHGIGHRDGRDLADPGEPVDEVLDLFGGDLLAAPVDHVLIAALDDQVACWRHPADVAAAVPAVVGEGPRVVLRGPVVAARRVGAAGEQRARLARRHVLVELVDEPHLVGGGERPALRGRDDGGRVVEAGVVEQALGHAEDLLQRQPSTGSIRRASSSASLAPPTCSTRRLASWAAAAVFAAPSVAASVAACSSQRPATAGTTAVWVTPSASITANARRGSGDGSMTTAPPASSVPRMPGQASGKLCPAGNVTRYLVVASTPDTAALARAL